MKVFKVFKPHEGDRENDVAGFYLSLTQHVFVRLLDFSPTTAALYEDVVTVLTVFCEKLESVSG